MGGGDVRMTIARRAARELWPGQLVNLGVGIPTLVADVLAGVDTIFLHTENGMVGLGPPPPQGQEDPDLVDAGKRPVTELPGSAYFHSADSFGMVRGGHVDVAILGALQVDEEGSVANWAVPGQPVLGVGGAMDLFVGAQRVIVATTLTTAEGRPKLVGRCSLPITGKGRVDTVVTESAVFRFVDGRFTLTELAPGITLDRLRGLVEARFDVLEPLGELRT